MKELLPKHLKALFLLCLMTCSILSASTREAYAQSQTVSGRVTDEQQAPVPGVNVLVKGTSQGTITDLEGNYRITVPADTTTLVYSFVGYTTREVKVNNQSTLDVSLMTDAQQLGEVVVTALGIRKDKAKLGYAVQEVKGEQLVKAREPSAISNLTGRVAGLQVANATELFKSPQVLLRGKSPLIVVDGVPINSDTWNLSPDDIESYTVLKGPTAAALYGSRGQNGAIQITTKRGTTDDKGFSVDFNASNQLQTGFNAVPKVQHLYGPGSYGQYAFVDGMGGGTNDSDFDVWGPNLDGRLIPQYDSPIDPATGQRIPTPFVPRGKDNLNNFLRDGFLSTNNIAVAASNDLGDIRMSVSHTYQRGIVPNTKMNITNFNLSGGLNLTEKFKVEANINYNKQYTPNTPNVNYGPNSMIYNLLIWNGSDFDIRDLKRYWKPGQEGLEQLNNEYVRYNNLWMVANEWLRGYYKDDVYGYIQGRYTFNDHWNLMARTYVSSNNQFQNQKFPYGATTYDREKRQGGYMEGYRYYFENNTDALLSYQNTLGGKFEINASVGGNLRTYNMRYNYGRTDYLIVPQLYTLTNTTTPISPESYRENKQVQSFYASADIAYNNYLYLGLTGRWDRSSTLPLSNNSFFYPSVSLSAVVSDMVELPEFISFLKVRGAYANVGNDLVPGGTYDVVNDNGSLNRFSYAGKTIYENLPVYSLGTPWNNKPTLYYTSVLTNPNLKPEFSTSFEEGLDVRFFNNRLGIDVAHYNTIDGPKIFNLPVSEASGYGDFKTNGLTTERRGWEVTLNATPVSLSNGFQWDVMVNWSTYKEVLKEIYGDLNTTAASTFGSGDGNGKVSIGSRVDQYYGSGFQRSADGQIVIGNDGKPVFDQLPVFYGYTNPDWFGGISNTLSYKKLSLGFLFDGRVGGKGLNYVNKKLWQSGRHEDAIDPLRDNDGKGLKSYVGQGVVVTEGELVRDGDGNVLSDTRQYAPNTTATYYQDWIKARRGSDEPNVVDKTFFKLREVTLTYNFPHNVLQKTFFEKASISLVARNLAYFSKYKNIDWDSFVNVQGGLQSPSVKSFGINLNATF